ncbi:MAG: PQQ-binding-like beta-propeller repeat protein, partial [Bacteroidales bacterium]|nr:PQQ-binding-like beta-propeller repeat protein [Bacteroidales bacterium]
MKRFFLTLTILSTLCLCKAQNASDKLIFALLADTHIGSGTSIEDLSKCIEDINAQPQIQFAILAGDITEFGSDEELALAKETIGKLKVPWYIVPGNHDTKWSESGCNSFNRLFGASGFSFVSHGFLFAGSNSGPNMRMGNAQVPREDLVWLDSLVKATPKEMPIIYIVHNPMDKSLANWDQVFDILKQGNIVLTLGGHWHANTFHVNDGVPGVLSRAVIAGGRETGYNIIKIDPETRNMEVFHRIAGVRTEAEPWSSLVLNNVDRSIEPSRPDYSFNDAYKNVEVVWQFQDSGDIGSGFAFDGSRIFYATAPGVIKAISATDGAALWAFKTDGRIYSFPYYSDGKVVCASTDGSVYCLEAHSGRLVWKYQTEKGIVACPLVDDGAVYIGSSCGKFYALDLKTGAEKWVYTGIQNFIEARPCADKEKVYIGSWGNEFYALNRQDGTLAWKWINGPNRNLSAAANFPVQTDGKVFITTPERITRALDKQTGAVIWEDRETKGRESQGLSPDKKTLYIKTMLSNELVGINA